jgi:galactoside O-acetyltransferase
MDNSFYSEIELSKLGLKDYGKNVLISKKCSIYSPEKISIGNNVRIDDFCILSGNIILGSNIHISTFVLCMELTE